MKNALKPILIIVGLVIALGAGVSLMGNVSERSISSQSSGLASKGLMGAVPESANLPSYDNFSVQSEAMDSDSGAGRFETGTANDIPVDKKIIKSGDLYLKVKEINVALGEINQIAKENQGEVFSSEISRTAEGRAKNGYVTVKVPVNNFDKAFGDLKKIASVVITESTSGQDVTEQYTDIQSRLKNKQAEEGSFARILDQAGKIDDVLAVTRELARVRGEIEVLQGRIRLMDSQTEMSTITMNITEDAVITVVDTWRPLQVMKNSVNGLIKSLQGVVNFLIEFIIQVLPVLLIWVLLIWLVYKIGKKIFLKIKNGRQVK